MAQSLVCLITAILVLSKVWFSPSASKMDQNVDIMAGIILFIMSIVCFIFRNEPKKPAR